MIETAAYLRQPRVLSVIRAIQEGDKRRLSCGELRIATTLCRRDLAVLSVPAEREFTTGYTLPLTTLNALPERPL